METFTLTLLAKRYSDRKPQAFGRRARRWSDPLVRPDRLEQLAQQVCKVRQALRVQLDQQGLPDQQAHKDQQDLTVIPFFQAP
jgi:hypothetical protein